MANGLFNIARGKIGYYGEDTLGLSAANSRLVVVPLSVVEADDVLNNHDTLAAVLAGGNTELTAGGWSRKLHAAAGVTYSVNDTTNTAKLVLDADDTWTSVATSNDSVKLLVCYDPDSTGGTDADIIPLTYHDFVVTSNGGDITADYDQVNGIWSSS